MTAALLAVDTTASHLEVSDFHMTTLGLTVQGTPTFAACEARALELTSALSAVQWALGDLSVYVRGHYGEEAFVQLVGVIGLAPEYVENLMTVCRRYPTQADRALSLQGEVWFTHYRTLAPAWIPPTSRHTLLTETARDGLTIKELDSAKRALWQDMYPDVPYTAANARKAANGEPLHPDRWRGDTGPRTVQEARTMVYFGALAPDDTQVIEVTGALDAAPPVAQPLLTVLPKTYAFTAKAYRTNGNVVLEPCNPPLPFTLNGQRVRVTLEVMTDAATE